MNNTYPAVPNYKRTTDKQYSLLKHRMAIYEAQSRTSSRNGLTRYKRDVLLWKELTEKLNKLGPPFRTVQQWKKVWSDHRRGLNKRKSKPKPEVIQKNVKAIKLQTAQEIAKLPTEIKPEPDFNTDYAVKPMIKAETEDYMINTETMHMTHSNDYDNDYSYNDNNEHFQQERYENTNESIIPDESTNNSYTYNQQNIEDSAEQHIVPPPLQPSNCRLPDQSIYALQQHMEHQTKLLEHMSQMSSTMAGLMQRQTDAIEKQTIAMLRQASATEKHTMVMNTFMDMIRSKMQKNNAKKSNSGTTTINLDDDDIL